MPTPSPAFAAQERSDRLIPHELELLANLLPLANLNIIELGCGAARLARDLLARHPSSQVTGLEVDTIQHEKNLAAAPLPGLQFLAAGAQAIPLPDDCFDLALMLKSLHHVPVPEMGTALGEIARVLKPGGYLYVSEPVYAGPLNRIVRLYNDEGPVRTAAQHAVDEALTTGTWVQVAERRFDMPVHFENFEAFETRMMRPSFAHHYLDDARVAAVRAAFLPHLGPDGADFLRPMHVRLLQHVA